MADIFLSYSRQDHQAAERIARRLEGEGFSVWWDKSLVAGEAWDESIRTELRSAHAVVVLWSKASWDSRWVHAEAQAGHERRILVAARLDDVVLEPPFNIVQTADAREDAGLVALIEGVRRILGTPQPAAHARVSRPASVAWRRNLPWLAGALTVVVIGVGAWMFLPRQHGDGQAGATVHAPNTSITVPAAPEASLAVLPFENLSSDKDNAFFATGIQDEILTRLTKIGSLKVISRTSTAHLASRPDNLPDIAKQLGVANILEGSVQREGNAVRVNVQLIKASTDTHLWAEIYDRKLDDIFAVQSEIAIAIAQALSAQVTGEEKTSLTQAPTGNLAAYDAYLRARALFSRAVISADLEKIAEFLKEAVGLDPNFALAWALLARSEAFNYFAFEATDAHRTAARTARDTALRLNPDLPEVQLAQGFYQYYVERDYTAARIRFEQLHAKWPGDAEATFALSAIAKRQGRWAETRSYFDQAIALDPLRADFRFEAVIVRIATRDFDSALREIDNALNRWPQDIEFVGQKAGIFQAQGRLDDADAALKPLIQARVDDDVWGAVTYQAILRRRSGDAIPMVTALLGQTSNPRTIADLRSTLGDLYRLSGDSMKATENYEQARRLYLAQSEKQPKNARLLRALAWTYCGLEDRGTALRYAEKAISLYPVSKDALQGPVYEMTRMLIWAHFGDRDHAILAIARLLKLPSESPLTPALLRLDPDFDKLRGDPRFEALAAGSQP